MARLSDLLPVQLPGIRLNGSTVYLRPPERSDWAQWAQLRGASRDFLQPWEPRWPPDALSRGAFRRRLARYAADWRGDEGYSLLLIRRTDEILVGGLSLANVRRGVADMGTLGYWIGERYAGRGYMREAVPLLLDFAFDRLALHRVEAACLPTNDVSRGLLLRSGFQEEGYARKYLRIDGEWRDHVLFAILNSDPRPSLQELPPQENAAPPETPSGVAGLD